MTRQFTEEGRDGSASMRNNNGRMCGTVPVPLR